MKTTTTTTRTYYDWKTDSFKVFGAETRKERASFIQEVISTFVSMFCWFN